MALIQYLQLLMGQMPLKFYNGFSSFRICLEALKMLSKIDAEINNIWVKKTIKKRVTDFFKTCDL